MVLKKILVTGASGFIGHTICETLSKSGRLVFGAVRNLNSILVNKNIKYIQVGDISSKKNWKDFLVGVDCIIHCAARVHKMNDDKNFDFYRQINLHATKHLAEHAIEEGVKRLVFLSSVKVNGESTDQINTKQKFLYKDAPNPQDSYARSKYEAEKVLWEISSRTGLEVVVVRLPLVYGYGVKGNLERLIKLVKSGVPLPLSLVKNQRSMIGIDNLVDLLIRCIDHPEASGKTFLASDEEDLSTPELIKLIASSIGKKANLFPLPIFMLKFLGSVFGKREEINRLVGSLRIDNSYTKEILNWNPPITVEEGIKRMVQGK
jgi:nucleoside-diphosphate-sugar epimerase